MDTYKTIKKRSEGIYKEKGSKFIGLAFPVFNEEQVKKILEDLRKEFHDARHHCYAYRLGANMDKYRVNDDGEPSSSAGKPIFGQIQSFELSNILIVVVRYFGGTKLGVSGLINAYRTAASEAIQAADVYQGIVMEKHKIMFEYPAMNDVMTVIKDENLEQSNQQFELSCSLTLHIRESESNRILQRLEKIETVKSQHLETS
ncbi:MAG: YigZ family protein [Marinilabiliales bacterium]|nr:MAG: YigZ family protein [Marinilabiliales bacterium]